MGNIVKDEDSKGVESEWDRLNKEKNKELQVKLRMTSRIKKADDILRKSRDPVVINIQKREKTECQQALVEANLKLQAISKKLDEIRPKASISQDSHAAPPPTPLESNMAGIKFSVEPGEKKKTSTKKATPVASSPMKLITLYTSSDTKVRDQSKLDKEIVGINELIKKLEYKKTIGFSAFSANSLGELINSVSEVQPSIVHFSGHGLDTPSIHFYDSSGGKKKLSKDAITQTLTATSNSVRLLFFNMPYDREVMMEVVNQIDAAICFDTRRNGRAATIFAAHFYSFIGLGYSVKAAFDLASSLLLIANIEEEGMPELFVNPYSNADQLILLPPA